MAAARYRFSPGRIGAASNRVSSLIPHGAEYEFRKLHFDTASVTNAPAMAAVLKLVPASQVMFGTDYPWRAAGGSLRELRSLGLSDADLRNIERESALGLFPRLRGINSRITDPREEPMERYQPSITRRGFLSGFGLALTNAVFGARPQAGAQGPAGAARTDPAEALASLIWDLVAANRVLADQQVLDGYGHVSVRNDHDPNRYLLARSMAPEITTADDIMEYDLESVPIDGRGRAMHSERFIHGEIYKVRAEVKSVVHFHAPSVVLMSVSGELLRPIYHMAGFLGDGVPLFDIRKAAGQMTNMLISDGTLGRALAHTLGGKPALLMRGHGAVVVGNPCSRQLAAVFI